MAEFHIVDYSISNLKALFQKYSKTPAQNLSTKIHLTYFEEYFKVLCALTSCFAREVRVGKKACVCSSEGCRGGGCQTLVCALGVLAYVGKLWIFGYM